MKIPIVFEKSGWWVIALIAVLKAGGAFVPIDPSQPVLRQKEIMNDLKAEFLLTSNQCYALLAEWVKTTVILSRSTITEISSKNNSHAGLPQVLPEAEAYVMYTSELNLAHLLCLACTKLELTVLQVERRAE